MSRIDAIKERVDIEDLAQKLGLLDGATKKNGEYKVRCIFHDERTPSMCIVPRKQMFHCFGCGAGKDVIDLFQQAKGITDRRDAMSELEDMYQIKPLPYTPLKRYRQERPEEVQGYETEPYGHAHWREEAKHSVEWGPDHRKLEEWWVDRGWAEDVLHMLAAEGHLGWAPVKKGREYALHFLFERGIKCRARLDSSRSNFWKEGRGSDCAFMVESLEGKENVVICEGETDAISLISECPTLMSKAAILGAPGASWHPNPLLAYRIAEGRNIVLVGDNDEAGNNFGLRLREIFLKEADEFAISRLQWKDYPGFGKGAGLDELLKSNFKQKVLTDLHNRLGCTR